MKNLFQVLILMAVLWLLVMFGLKVIISRQPPPSTDFQKNSAALAERHQAAEIIVIHKGSEMFPVSGSAADR